MSGCQAKLNEGKMKPNNWHFLRILKTVKDAKDLTSPGKGPMDGRMYGITKCLVGHELKLYV